MAMRVQSFSTEVAATPASVPQTATALTWTGLKPGTYLLESGTHPSIQGPMGLYGIVVVTTAPTNTARGVAYGSGTTAVNYDAEVPLLFSEIDPVQNNAVQAAVNTANFDELKPWSGQPNKCGNPASGDYHTCYPPAVNYTPLYYLINGVAFDKTNPNFSLFPATPNTGTGVSPTVLVRLVNAGLRMHVPSIVGRQDRSKRHRRIFFDCRRRQSSARRAPRTERSLSGCWENLRCDDECVRSLPADLRS